jgi:hypothetical protein
MLTTTGRPKLFQTVRRAWRSLFQAAGQMIPLFVIAYILMAALDIAAARAPAMLSIPLRDTMKQTLTDGRSLKALDLSKAIGLDIVTMILRAMILAPVAVAMHRFILLGETRRLFFVSRLSLRFAAWIMALDSLALIAWWLILFATGSTGLVPTLYLLMFALVIFLIQLLPLFPAVAVEESSPTVSARLETALERAENVFLLTIGALILTFLPVGVAQAIAVKAFAKLAEQAPLIVPLARAAMALIVTALTAAVMSFLYSYCAQRPRAAPTQDALRLS